MIPHVTITYVAQKWQNQVAHSAHRLNDPKTSEIPHEHNKVQPQMQSQGCCRVVPGGECLDKPRSESTAASPLPWLGDVTMVVSRSRWYWLGRRSAGVGWVGKIHVSYSSRCYQAFGMLLWDPTFQGENSLDETTVMWMIGQHRSSIFLNFLSWWCWWWD